MSETRLLGPLSAARSVEARSRTEAREEFERTARRFARPLKALAERLASPDHDLAEDLVQHAFAAGYRMLLEGRFEARAEGAYTWFSTAIRNEFFAHRRRQARIDRSESAQRAYEQAQSDEAADARHEASLLGEGLLEALGKLPEDQRICVELVDLGGLDYRSAARALRIPLGTVRSRLARARLKLAASLSRQEYHP